MENAVKCFWVKACLLALLVLSLGGCAGGGPLEGADAPDVLHVVRDTVPGHHFVPLDVVIRDVPQVQALYKAAYALQTVPPGEVLHCPIDYGVEYRLDFLYRNALAQVMQLDAGGCRLLDLNAAGSDFWGVISTHDGRFTTPAFRAFLAKMLKLPSLAPPYYQVDV